VRGAPIPDSVAAVQPGANGKEGEQGDEGEKPFKEHSL